MYIHGFYTLYNYTFITKTYLSDMVIASYIGEWGVYYLLLSFVYVVYSFYPPLNAAVYTQVALN